MFSERDMEDAIVSDPERFLKIKELKLLERQYRIGNFIFDLIYEEQNGNKLIVEIQKGVLDRNHAFKIVDYAIKYQNDNPTDSVSTLVVANKILPERKQFLENFGIMYLEIFDEEIINWKRDKPISEMTSPDVGNKSVAHLTSKRVVKAFKVDSFRQLLYTKLQNSLKDIYWKKIDYTKNNITALAGLSGCEWVIVTRKDDCRIELAFRNKTYGKTYYKEFENQKEKIEKDLCEKLYWDFKIDRKDQYIKTFDKSYSEISQDPEEVIDYLVTNMSDFINILTAYLKKINERG